MKLLTFTDHTEACISHCLLYGKRLGMEIYLAGADFRAAFGLNLPVGDSFAGAFLDQQEWRDDKLYPAHSMECTIRKAAEGELDNVFIRDISFEEFMSEDFDYVLLTRNNLIKLTEKIREQRPKINFLGYSGNVGMRYPSHYAYIGASLNDYWTHDGKRLLIFLELLPCFCFALPSKDDMLTVRSFVSFIAHSEIERVLLEFEDDIAKHGYRLFIQGFNNRDGCYLTFSQGARLYQSMVAGIHLKSIDGYGLVLAHIAAVGRPILTDFSFYMGKTLWPIVQTWGIHVNAGSGHEIADIFLRTSINIERMEKQARWVQDYFNYEKQADVVKTFLGEL